MITDPPIHRRSISAPRSRKRRSRQVVRRSIGTSASAGGLLVDWRQMKPLPIEEPGIGSASPMQRNSARLAPNWSIGLRRTGRRGWLAAWLT
jgi:hypothetical protein